MPTALPLPTLIDQTASHKEAQRVLRAQFNDGYEQVTPDGPNPTMSEWVIQWPNLTEAERDTVVGALRTVGSSLPLSWTPFGDSTEKLFRVPDGFTETFPSGVHYTISTTLKETK